MALKLPDSAVPMGDFPVAKAVDIDFNDGENLQEKLDNGKLGGAGGGASTYTSLEALGLTADATVEDVVNALKNGESFLAPVNTFTNYETIFPNKVPNDQWNKIHIIKGASLASSHIRCFSPSGTFEYLANINNTNIVAWNDVSGAYIDISDSIIEKLGTEILKYPVGKYRINSTTTGNKFTDLPSNAEMKCGLIEVNGTAVGKSPFTDTWVYRMYKFECLMGTTSYVRRLNSGATAGQIEVDTDWCKEGQDVYTSLSQLGLTAPISVGEIYNAMPDNTMAILGCEDTVDHIADVPIPYGVLTIKKNGSGRFSIDYQNSLQSSPCNVKRWIGTLKGLDGTGLYWRLISTQTTYTALSDMKLTAGATVQDVIDSLPIGDTALLRTDAFTNWSTLFNGIQWGYLKIEKTVSGLSNIELQEVISPNRRYFGAQSGGRFSAWQQIGSTTLVTNTSTLKLDVTKKNGGWYGAIKLTYLYDTSPAEIEISFRAATEDLRWAVINGQKYVKQITFTQDGSNTAHYTIGIEFSGTTYGCYQAEVIGGFAVINSLTNEAFTGAKTAVYYSPWGKNNGVTLVSAPEDIGLTFPCTSVQLAQAMRNKFNKTINAGAIGIFNCGGKATTITDAPADYGLLHIETFGHDRILIRFDGIGSSSYAGSWIGQIKGNNGTFSSITWSRLDNENRISELEADVDELFQSVSSGKTLVANAITGKGVSTATNATFATMATNVGKITNYTASEKQALATAITNKGVSTSSAASFSTMATNISQIPQTITWQEETVSASPDSTSRVARFVFSNTVLGVKQIIAPGYNYTAEATETKMFTINGNTVEVKVESGTWRMTAMVRSS